MNIKKEYEKFFERKKNDLCVHDAEDVIEFAKHYQALQLQQSSVVGQSEQFYCNQDDGEYNNNPCSEQCRFCKEAKSLQ